MVKPKLKMFGTPRSGTNFTRTILERNFNCEIVYDEMGWKHAFYSPPASPRFAARGFRGVLSVVKNPFSCLVSWHDYMSRIKRHLHGEKEWKRFLRGRVLLTNDFHEGFPQFRFANPVQYWNDMNWHYATLHFDKAQPAAVVRYEDALNDAEAVASALASQYGLERITNPGEFVVPKERVKNMGDNARDSADYVTKQKFDASFQKGQAYFRSFDREDLEFVLAELDHELMTKLGYQSHLEAAAQRYASNQEQADGLAPLPARLG